MVGARLGAIFVLLPAAVFAVGGEPDPGFGTGGVVVTATIVESVGGVALQPDGAIVVAAATPYSDPSPALVLARFRPDGTRDDGFGNGGEVRESVGVSFAPALRVEPDGSLTVAATRCAADCDGTVRRYDADGHPDPSFTAIDRFIASPTYVEVMARDREGRLVVGGNAGHAPGFLYWLARYGADGTPDATFGTGGLVSDFVSPHGASLGSVVVQDDDSIVAAITGGTPEGVFSSVVRFSPSGNVDQTVPTFFGRPLLAPAPNGTIVAAGTLQSDQQPTPRITLSRFDAVLGFDPTFPGDDALGGPIGVSSDVLVQPDGAIVVAAALGDENSPRFALLRWTVDGAVDGGFGNAGVAIAFADRPGAAQRLVRQPDGKLLAAGLLPTGASGPLVLARFLADGTTSTTGAPRTTTTTMTGTTLPGGTTSTTLAGTPPTTLAPRAICASDADCGDGDGCTIDRCDAGRCVHDPASGVDAVTCLCAAPLPECDRRGAVRVTRACRLVARAGTRSGERSGRLLRRAGAILQTVAHRAALRLERVPDPACEAAMLQRVDELRRRTALVGS